MRSLRPVSPLLVALGLAVCSLNGTAQRNGAAPQQAAPHPAVRPGPAMHTGSPAMHAHPSGQSSQGIHYSNPGSLFPSPGITSTRPVYFSNGIMRYGTDPHHERRGTSGNIGFLNLGYAGELGLEEDPDFLDTTYNPNTAQDAFPTQIPNTLSAPQPEPQGFPQPQPDSYREPEQAPESYVAAPEPRRVPEPRRAPEPKPLPEEDAVTIIFKDGRPSEQVHNYALTRTALYVTAGRVRTIPIDQIDVPATEAANAKSGVEFHLPSTQSDR